MNGLWLCSRADWMKLDILVDIVNVPVSASSAHFLLPPTPPLFEILSFPGTGHLPPLWFWSNGIIFRKYLDFKAMWDDHFLRSLYFYLIAEKDATCMLLIGGMGTTVIDWYIKGKFKVPGTVILSNAANNIFFRNFKWLHTLRICIWHNPFP